VGIWFVVGRGSGTASRTLARSGLTSADPRLDAPPSVGTCVLITFCTLRADRIGCYGYEHADTPNMDALARDGVVFDNHYTQASFSGGSFATILTGRYCSGHGVFDHPRPLAEDNVTIAEVLRDRGYRTAAFVTHSFLKAALGFNQGFETFRMGKRPGRQSQLAAQWIDGHAQERFFLWYQAEPGHYPYSGPRDLIRKAALPLDTAINRHAKTHGRDKRSLGRLMFEFESFGYTRHQFDSAMVLYDATVSFADRQVGRIVGQLKKSGLYEQSLIVVTADHGDCHGEHDVYFNHASNLYEPTVHVPLILHWPQSGPGRLVGAMPKRSAGMPAPSSADSLRRIAAVTRHIDLLPTLAEAAGAAVPQQVDGLGLLPLLTGEAPPREAFAESAVLRPERAGLAHYRQYLPGVPGKWRMIRSGDYKLICVPGENPVAADLRVGRSPQESSPTFEVYNLAADPQESHNLAEELPDLTRTLADKLEAWFARYDTADTTPREPTPEELEQLRSLGYID